ncbi:MAG: hypothetical protein OXF62_17045 [Caldilineaceae bacterium]|nr:hypothetical protein [Caldilineaceae bacterium]
MPPAIAAVASDGQLTPAQRRRLLLSLSLRRQKPGTGSAPQFLRGRSARYAWPDLRDLLKGLRWAVVGAVATRAYMPERMTSEFKVLVHPEDSGEALARLRSSGFRLATELSIPGCTLQAPDGTEIHLLLVPFAWIDDAFQRLRRDAAGFPVLELPYLVLMKLETSRAQDLADLSKMLGLAADEELDRTRECVARYMPEASDDLESLIYLGRLEMKDV